MNRLQLLRRRGQESRYTVDDYAGWVNEFYYGGAAYGLTQTWGSDASGDRGERIEGNFAGYVQGAYKRNGVVFACQVARMLVFTEARFMFQQMRNRRPGELFGTDELAILERPWPNGTTGQLLSRMLQDVDLAGNFYGRRTMPTATRVEIERLRPDWVTIVLGRDRELITDTVIGYLYWPDGPNGDRDPVGLTVDEVVHWAPTPDPLGEYRGMSWLTPAVRDIAADSAAMTHKLKFFDHAATPNMVISYDPQFQVDQISRAKALVDAEYGSVDNAYKTMHLAGGADVTVVGSSFEQMAFAATIGHGETRICAYARVPAVIVGLSEGLQAATYSNYGQARRHFGDSWARPMWRSAADSLATIINVPNRARLWYDDRDIAFLQEDRKDAVEILQTQMAMITNLVREGFTAESSKTAVLNEDPGLLEHTGRLSVQLKGPDEDGDSPDDDDIVGQLAALNGAT